MSRAERRIERSRNAEGDAPSGAEGKSSMRKMLCEIDLEKAQGYPGRYLEHFSTMNRAPAYAECLELIAKLGLDFFRN